MTIDQGQSVTEAVLAVMPATPDERLSTATRAMVRHFHAAIRETKPTQRMVECGLEFLIGLGRATALNGRCRPVNDPGIAACRLEQDLIPKAGHALLPKPPMA
ncbi:hypothetical protein GCM10007874_37440 [Labrys miyagiensis]|uniref:Uncharacterized protein n=1 Tax=Labrys miyagiensis TaxID=346912 RepID=A0ABQ6CR43_9HYPH|nr:dioxygenase [Labrys miyagiensis]GLS20727.1 hypothetical protein GCM10007874_37440 [Labrys miyagiensis]